MSITKESFGQLPDGREVERYTLSNDYLSVQILSYGGIINSVKTPDANGVMGEVVLGFDSLKDYLEYSPYFGCITGRFANRIAQGRFELVGQSYQLAQNNGENHLHGGNVGFDKQLWKAEAKGDSLKLSYTSPDGEEGYPGELQVSVTYSLKEDGLELHYEAQTNKSTLLNLTNHTYFNLANDGTILDHEIKLAAEAYTPVDAGLIPTGELRPVAGTPFDFTTPKPIGQDISQEDEQLKRGGGYDHNFVLKEGTELKLVAAARDPKTAKGLEVYTTEPGVQFYSGNMMPKIPGRNGQTYDYRMGFCLETQHFPDNPNQPNFAKSILHPGETYRHTTLFRFPKAPYSFA
ncbi:MAG: galactose mutarotase [Trueperaceae bacterium]|nr:galactose mutarotase [Trueperaceae bacterium]